MSNTVADRIQVWNSQILDVASRDCHVARRNILLGFWAARRLGLADNEVEAYAWSVHLADFEAPGHDDVVKKIVRDFAARGRNIREQVIRNQLREMELRAFFQMSLEHLSTEVTSCSRKRRTGRVRIRVPHTLKKAKV